MSEEIKINFVIPMKRIKKDVTVTDENLTIREIFQQEGQNPEELDSIVVDEVSADSLPQGYDTPIRDLQSYQNNERVYLWGMIQSQGGDR